MKEKIINCYELDIKQDIPADMVLLRTRNVRLKNSNYIFKIMLISIGVGVVLFTIYKRVMKKNENENK